MATAQTRTRTETRMVEQRVEVPDGVTLHLTEDEAVLVAVLVGKVSGSMQNPARKHASAIWAALRVLDRDSFSLPSPNKHPRFAEMKALFAQFPVMKEDF